MTMAESSGVERTLVELCVFMGLLVVASMWMHACHPAPAMHMQPPYADPPGYMLAAEEVVQLIDQRQQHIAISAIEVKQ